jgi:hypothetical protein
MASHRQHRDCRSLLVNIIDIAVSLGSSVNYVTSHFARAGGRKLAYRALRDVTAYTAWNGTRLAS